MNSLLNSKIGEYRKGSMHEIRYCCPKCIGKSKDTKFHLYVNFVKEKFICHRCGWCGNLDKLLRFFDLDIDTPVNGDWLVTLDNLLNKCLANCAEDESLDVELPSDYAKCIEGTNAWDYLISRGFTVDMICERSVGIGTKQNKGLLIFPEWVSGRLRYWTAKPYGKRQIPKNASVKKSGYVYWLDKINGSKEVVITEGVFDSIVFENGVALLGSNCSRLQLQQLINRDFGKYFIALDGDALDKSLLLAGNLFQHGKLVKILVFPKNEDPSSLGKTNSSFYKDNAKTFDVFHTNLEVLIGV